MLHRHIGTSLLCPQLNPDQCLQRVAFLTEEMAKVPAIESVTKISNLTAELTDNNQYKKIIKKHLKRHIANTYKEHAKLKHYLSIIIDYIQKHPTDKIIIYEKLIEGMENCTPGFQDRAYDILSYIYEANNLYQQLTAFRGGIAEIAYFKSESKDSTDAEVHTKHRFKVRAMELGFAIPGDATCDPYRGLKKDQVIDAELVSAFNENFTPAGFIDNSWNYSPLAKYGYVGRKAPNTSYNIGEYIKIRDYIKKIIHCDDLSISDCFVIENDCIVDIDWFKINSYFLSFLYQNNFIRPLEQPEEMEFQEQGQSLSISYPKGDISQARMTYQFIEDDVPTVRHLLLNSNKRKEYFQHIPYSLLRPFLQHVLFNLPSTQVLGLIEPLIALGDEELQQEVNNNIVVRLMVQHRVIDVIKYVSTQRLNLIFEFRASEFRRMLAIMNFDQIKWSDYIDESEKYRFIYYICANDIARQMAGIEALKSITKYMANVDFRSCAVFYGMIGSNLEASVKSSEDALWLLTKVQLNISRAICQIVGTKLQTFFQTKDSIKRMLSVFRTSSVQVDYPNMDMHMLFIYRTLKPKILSFFASEKQLPIETQYNNILDFISILTPSAEVEFIRDIKDYLPALISNWQDLARLILLVHNKEKLSEVFTELKEKPYSLLSKKTITWIEYGWLCHLDADSIVMRVFTEAFADNILASVDQNLIVPGDLVRDFKEEKFAVFCHAVKPLLPLIFKQGMYWPLEKIRIFLNIVEDDIKNFITNPNSIHFLVDLYAKGVIQQMKAATKDACGDQIKTLADLRLWYAEVERSSKKEYAAAILYNMIGTQILSLVTIPQDFIQLLNGETCDLWIVNAIIRKIPEKQFASILKKHSAAIRHVTTDFSKLMVLISGLEKNDAKRVLKEIRDVNYDCRTQVTSMNDHLIERLEGNSAEINKMVLEKINRGLLQTLTKLSDIPSILGIRTNSTISTSDLIFTVMKDKVAELITSARDCITLIQSYKLRQDQIMVLFKDRDKGLSHIVKNWKDLITIMEVFWIPPAEKSELFKAISENPESPLHSIKMDPGILQELNIDREFRIRRNRRREILSFRYIDFATEYFPGSFLPVEPVTVLGKRTLGLFPAPPPPLEQAETSLEKRIKFK